ncbi:D-alanyl-D-alanine-carboxypeptidase/endopeptidaseAmpH [Thermoflexales bacterium]|nr:D-alanyl-D-alanine-carboxypeptidase/endopeptidaseAmpH [Thermoflexales bacterium]
MPKICTALLLMACLWLAVACTSAATTPTPTSTSVPAPSPTVPAPLTDAELQALLKDRVERSRRSVGIVVGIVDETGRRVIAYGTTDRDNGRPVDGDTVFEIGSATKVFNASLLADMVQRGEVKLDDPVTNYLPATVTVPTRQGKAITLLDLATHTSGLPRLPDNFKPQDSANPYADYQVQQLYDFLSTYTLTHDIGTHYEYSNLGAGLLGHALSLKAGQDYETLLTERVLKPLGLSQTRITLSPEMKQRLAIGHDVGRMPTTNWDFPTLAGAGALRSTTNDLLTFLEANLGISSAALSPALEMTHSARRDAGGEGEDKMQVGLGWHLLTVGDTDIIWHNGGTGGYRSFIGFDKAQRRGVVVLTNTANDADDIGLHLLEPRSPLKTYPDGQDRKVLKLDQAQLDAFVGTYTLAPTVSIEISRVGDQLYLQITGQGKLPLYAETDTEFFLSVVDAQITFKREANGKVTHLVLHQNGLDTQGEKSK